MNLQIEIRHAPHTLQSWGLVCSPLGIPTSMLKPRGGNRVLFRRWGVSFLTLFPCRENVGFYPPDAEPSVRSRTPHRSPARDLRALAPLVGALSTVLRPPLREVASSLSTHELTDVWKTDSSAMTRFGRDRGGSRAREGGRVAERGQCLSGRWCEPAPGHRRRAAPPVSS